MMWFDSKDRRALFIDKRAELHLIEPTAKRKGRRPRKIEIAPDIVASFTDMPFPDDSFGVVVFDPPHMTGARAGGPRGQFRKMYAALPNDWREVLRQGFAECFRVPKPGAVLIFKWAESSIPLSDVLELTGERPLFGHRTSVHTHWCVFMKPSSAPIKEAVK